MATNKSTPSDETSSPAEKASPVVFKLETPDGREYLTSSQAEATNRVTTQGYKLKS